MLQLPLLSLPFHSPGHWVDQTSSLFFLTLTLTLETLARNPCFQGSAPGTPDLPSPNQLPSSAWRPRPRSGGWPVGVVGRGGGAPVSVLFATAPEVLIKLSLQEKQKLRSHFGLPWSPRSPNSWENSTSPRSPKPWVALTPTNTLLPACRAPAGRNDLIATAIGHSGQFHGRYLFFSLDAERIFSSPAVSMETPATLLAIPLPTSCFSDQYWSLAPHWLPTADGGRALGRRDWGQG